MTVELSGNNTLENLIVNSSSFLNTAISVFGAGNLITGSQVNASNNTNDAPPDVIGIIILGNDPSPDTLTIQNSVINAFNDKNTYNAYGILLANLISTGGSSLNMSASEINATLSDNTTTQNVYGILTQDTEPTTPHTINLSDTKITTTHNGVSGNNSSIHLEFNSDTGTALNSQFMINSASGITDGFISGNSTSGIIPTNVICVLNGLLSTC